MTHLIRQHYLHVALSGTESAGLALQARLPGICEQALLPAIEQVLERCAPPEGWLCIERLEIDAGTLKLEHLERELAESVVLLLEKALGDQIPPLPELQEPRATGPAQKGSRRPRPSPTSPTNSPAVSARAGSTAALAPPKVRYKTERETIDEALLHFLSTGSLPWSYRPPQGCSFEQALRDRWGDSATPEGISGATNDALLRVLASATARERLVRQFAPLFLETFFSRLGPQGSQVLDAILQVLRSCGSAVETKYFARRLWEAAFAALAAGKAFSAKLLVAEAWSALPASAADQNALAGVLGRHWPECFEAPISATPTNVKTASRDQACQHPETVEGIYLENAGLVLLHPFLPTLFEGLGIATEGKLLQPERALCLLHFLATGQSVAPEYHLMLPKVLCGVALENPMEADVDLRADEFEEAEALLQAVIRHWGALRNSSPDALRGTFLLRPGKLSLRGGDWLLQVEAQTCDLLLDQLPWSVSMIQLPWMEQKLWVEWR